MKNVLKLIFVLGIAFTMSSCYTYTLSVGEGAQTGVEYRKMNHYLIYGLAPISISDPKEMVGDDVEDYEVTIKHTFIDGLINAITFGIYTPTTTIVRK